MTQDITSLIEKLEGAEVGSRELDCRVVAWSEGVIDGEHWSDDDLAYALTDPDRTCNPAPVTTSLDAALALAERVGVRPYQADASIKGKWSWMVVDEARLGDLEANPYARATAATPALALCAALLRAQSEAR